MAAATTHGGKLSRLAARTTGIGIALIGHLTVLSALAYYQASQTTLGELPVAIAVDIVSVPAPRAAAESPQRAVADDDSHQQADAVDQPQADPVEQTNSPAQPVTTAAHAIAAMTVVRHSTKSEVTNRQNNSLKRQAAPVETASDPIAAPDADNEASTTSSLVSANVPSTWKNRLLSHLDRYKRYPGAARAQGAEGTALLSFAMDRDGRVLTFYLVRSSGCAELDDEVLEMIQRASPLPAAPAELHERVVQLVVPVRFRL